MEGEARGSGVEGGSTGTPGSGVNNKGDDESCEEGMVGETWEMGTGVGHTSGVDREAAD